MTKQDERQRLRRRLQEYALELANGRRWQEAAEINEQILELGTDPATYNRLGKAYQEQGMFSQARDAYQKAIQVSPTNIIARKNLSCLENLLQFGIDDKDMNRQQREQVDPRFFVTEAGKTTLTTLVDVTHSPVVMTLTTAEKVLLSLHPTFVGVEDLNGNLIGRLEPRLSQRLSELMEGGNRYVAAVVQSDSRQVRLLIREVYQHPSQLARMSFPGKLGDSMGMYGYSQSLRYDYEVDDILEEEEFAVGGEEGEGEYIPSDDEELGLDALEKDIADDDDGNDD